MLYKWYYILQYTQYIRHSLQKRGARDMRKFLLLALLLMIVLANAASAAKPVQRDIAYILGL